MTSIWLGLFYHLVAISPPFSESFNCFRIDDEKATCLWAKGSKIEVLQNSSDNTKRSVPATNVESKTHAIFVRTHVQLYRPVVLVNPTPGKIGEICCGNNLSDFLDNRRAFANI